MKIDKNKKSLPILYIKEYHSFKGNINPSFFKTSLISE